MRPGAELQQGSGLNHPETAPQSSPERRIHPAAADAAYGSSTSQAHGSGHDLLGSPRPALSPPVMSKHAQTRVKKTTARALKICTHMKLIL